MPLNIDAGRALRTFAEVLSLIGAVQQAVATDETDAVEWKGAIPDVGSKEWMAELARHVIGMANRLPDAASQAFEGCGYLIMGVEPGSAPGVSTLDPADVENKLRPYLGADGPRWSWMNVGYSGVNVAVVTVESPRLGDPIHTLRREFRGFREGTIFVRRQGKTEPASAADVLMLTERAMRAATRLDVSVMWATPAPEMPIVDLSAEAIEAWVATQVREMTGSAERVSAQGAPGANALFPGLAAAMGAFIEEEERSLDEYLAEVRSWAAKATDALGPHVRELASRQTGRRPLRPVVRNATDRNFENVRLEIHVPGEVTAHVRLHSRFEAPMPARPKPFGPRQRSFAFNPAMFDVPAIGPVVPPRVWVDNSGSARVNFEIFDLRPQYQVTLSPFWLVGAASLAGSQVAASWHATATNVDGLVEGKLSVTIEPRPLSIDEVLGAPPEDAEDDDD